MTDRLTDAELRAIDVAAPVSPPTVAEVHALVAEVQEHRAARTLTDEEREHLDAARWEVGDHRGLHRPLALSLLAIIDRITEESPDA